jgi:hypothetical protein
VKRPMKETSTREGPKGGTDEKRGNIEGIGASPSNGGNPHWVRNSLHQLQRGFRSYALFDPAAANPRYSRSGGGEDWLG